MPKIDYLHDGTEHEYEASMWTLVLYEQEFKRDLIKDVYGRIDLRNASKNFDEDGNMVAMDYTVDNWIGELRAFWAMLRTSSDIAKDEGRAADEVPSFDRWSRQVSRATHGVDGGINMGEISQAVFNECNRGLFHTGAAASE